jgi:hypothetical protein
MATTPRLILCMFMTAWLALPGVVPLLGAMCLSVQEPCCEKPRAMDACCPVVEQAEACCCSSIPELPDAPPAPPAPPARWVDEAKLALSQDRCEGLAASIPAAPSHGPFVPPCHYSRSLLAQHCMLTI